MRDDVVAEIWQRRRMWSAASGKFQSETKACRLAQILLIVAGATLATAAATDLLGLNDPAPASAALGNRIVAGLGAAALALVGVVEHHFLSRTRSERWPRCRSVAEGLKSEIFKFRAGAKPYDTPPTSNKDPALTLLNKIVEEHEEKAQDLLRHVYFDAQSPEGAPGVLDHDGYIKARLDDQIDNFYLPSARRNLEYANAARWAMIVLAMLGVLISALMTAGVIIGAGAWVSVLTTVSAAIATIASLNRFEFLASTYSKQAYALSKLRREWKSDQQQDWSDFVVRCEETISAENRAWTAEMLKERETLEGVLPDDGQGAAA